MARRSRFEKLTPDAIRTLQAGQKITEHGIVVEKLPNGDARFRVAVMIDRQGVGDSEGIEIRDGEAVRRHLSGAFAGCDVRPGRGQRNGGRSIHSAETVVMVDVAPDAVGAPVGVARIVLRG